MGSLRMIHKENKMIRQGRDLSCTQLKYHVAFLSQLRVLGLKALCSACLCHDHSIPRGVRAKCHFMFLDIALEQHCTLKLFVMM